MRSAPKLAVLLAVLPFLSACYYFQDDINRIVHPPKAPKVAPAYVAAFQFQGTVQGDPRALSWAPALAPGAGPRGLARAWAASALPLRDLAFRDLDKLKDQRLGEEILLVFQARGSELTRAQAALEDGRFVSEPVALDTVRSDLHVLEVAIYRASRTDTPLLTYALPFDKPSDREKLVQEVFLRQDKTAVARTWREAAGVSGPVDGLVVTVDTDVASLAAADRAKGGVRRLSSPDGLQLFDVDGDGVWGETDDDAVLPVGRAWTQAAAQVVDRDLDGVAPGGQQPDFGAGLTVQDAVAELFLAVEPSPLAVGGPGAVLRVSATPRPSVGLPVGVEVEFDISGTSPVSGAGTLVLDRVTAGGRVEGDLALLAPARSGTVKVTASVKRRRDGDLSAALAVPAVEAVAALAVVELALDRTRAVPGQDLSATLQVRNDGGEPFTIHSSGLAASAGGVPVGAQLKVVPDADNPTEVGPGRTVSLRYKLELAPEAVRGVWSLEAYIAGTLAGAPAPVRGVVRGVGKAYSLEVVSRARLRVARAPDLPLLAPGEEGTRLEVELENPGGAEATLSSVRVDFADTRLTARRTDTTARILPSDKAVLSFELTAAADVPLASQAWTLVVAAVDGLDGRAVALEQTASLASLSVQAKTPGVGAVKPEQVKATASDAERTVEVIGAQFYALQAAWIEAGATRVDLEILPPAGPTSPTSPTSFRARVPAGAAPGIYTLRVRTASGDSSAAGPTLQVLALPQVSASSQDAVAVGRDAEVVLTGQNLGGVSRVVLSGGGAQSTEALVVSALQDRLKVRVPATLGLGTYEFRLTTAAGETDTGRGLQVLPAPRVSFIDPGQVPAGQATQVTIRGERFKGALDRLTLSDGTALTGVQLLDENTIQATVPASVKPGVYEVQLSTTWLGRGASSGAVLVVHRGAATVRVTRVELDFGPEGSSQTVTVSGENFMGASSVALVDDTVAPSRQEPVALFRVDTDLQLTATVPASVPAGDYELQVTTPLGSSTGTSAAGARYRRLLAALPTTRETVPSTGSTDQATTDVVVTGTGFLAGQTRVHLVDGSAEHEVTVNSVQASTLLRITVPMGLPSSTYTVRATVDANVNDRRVGVENRALFVVNPPGAAAVDSLEPPIKRESGIVSLQVKGRNFTGAVSARWKRLSDNKEFGASDGVGFTPADDTAATATVPEGMNGSSGEYVLLVTRSSGVENVASAVRLRVPEDPRVTGLSLTEVTAGETPEITVTGRNLYAPARVELVDVGTGAVAGTLTGTAVPVPGGTTLTGLGVPAAVGPGEYHVRVVTPFGTGVGNMTSGKSLTVLAAPQITSVSPRGLDRTRDNNTLQVQGTNFRAGVQVRLVGSSGFTVLAADVRNPTLLDATVPSGLPVGAYRVEVRAGASAPATSAELYLSGPPEVTGLQPATVPSRATTSVQAAGALFQARDTAGDLQPPTLPATVQAWWVNTVDSSLVFPANASITAPDALSTEVPSTLPVGVYALRLNNPWGAGLGGRVATAGAPKLTALDTTGGLNTGSTPVNITGENFIAVTQVRFEAVDGPAKDLGKDFGVTTPASYTATSLAVVVPPGKYPGTYRVKVFAPAGDTGDPGPAARYKVSEPPAVVSTVTPAQGRNDQPVPLTISGENLLGTTRVTLGGWAALLNLQVVNAQTVKGDMPVGLAGQGITLRVLTTAGEVPLAQAYTAYDPLLAPADPLASGETGLAYDQTLASKGGWGTKTWTEVSGAWPQGLSLGADGRISGTPGVAGEFTLEVEVADGDGNRARRPVKLRVAGWEELAGSGSGGGLSDTTVASTGPSLAVDSQDRLILAWLSDGKVFVRRWDGAAWAEPVSGSATGTGLWAADKSPSLAVGPLDKPVVAFTSSASGITMRELDNGAWKTMGTSGPALRSPASWPMLSASPEGGPVVAYVTTDGGATYVWTARYGASGWSPMGSLSSMASFGNGLWSHPPGTTAQVPDHVPAVAALSDGTAWVAWIDGASPWGPLYAAHTGTAVRSRVVSDAAAVSLAAMGTRPRMAWLTFAGPFFGLYLARHTGQDWVELGGSQTGAGISGNGRVGSYALALDALGRPALAWSEGSSGAGLRAVRWSGRAWEPLGGSSGVVTSDTTAAMPSLAVDTKGRVVLAWQQTVNGVSQVFLRRHTGFGDARDGVDPWNQAVYEDGFDSYSRGSLVTVAGWNLVSTGGGTPLRQAISDVGYGSTQGMNLESGISAPATVEKAVDGDADFVTLDARVRVPALSGTAPASGTLARLGFWNKDLAGGAGVWFGGMSFDADGKVRGLHGTWSEAWKYDQWYQVRVVQDNARSTYDLYLDGALKAKSLAFSTTGGSFKAAALSAEAGGSYTLHVDDVKIYRDPPTRFAAIGSPLQGATVDQNLTVTGSAVGLAQVQVWLWTSESNRWDNQGTVNVDGSGRWTAAIQAGLPAITRRLTAMLEARSMDGTVTSRQITVYRDPPPKITIDSPGDGSLVPLDVVVTGKAVSLTQVEVWDSSNRGAWSLRGSSSVDSAGNWTVTRAMGPVNLTARYTADLEARSPDGRVLSNRIRVYRDPPKSIQISSVVEAQGYDARTPQRWWTISGQATGLDQVLLRFDGIVRTSYVYTVSSNRWVGDFYVGDPNITSAITVTVEAVASDGSVASAPIKVTRTVVASISISQPSGGSTVQRSVVVTGQAYGMSQVTVWVYTNQYYQQPDGNPGPIPVGSDGSWRMTATVGAVTNASRLTAKLEVRPPAGVSIPVFSVTVYRDSSGSISITTPADHAVLDVYRTTPSNGQFQVSGTATGLAGQQIRLWVRNDNQDWDQGTTTVTSGGTWSTLIRVGSTVEARDVPATIWAKTSNGLITSNVVPVTRRDTKFIRIDTPLDYANLNERVSFTGWASGLNKVSIASGGVSSAATIDAQGNWNGAITIVRHTFGLIPTDFTVSGSYWTGSTWRVGTNTTKSGRIRALVVLPDSTDPGSQGRGTYASVINGWVGTIERYLTARSGNLNKTVTFRNTSSNTVRINSVSRNADTPPGYYNFFSSTLWPKMPPLLPSDAVWSGNVDVPAGQEWSFIFNISAKNRTLNQMGKEWFKINTNPTYPEITVNVNCTAD